jgi:tetratricopeptide (TPR) repeat protein
MTEPQYRFLKYTAFALALAWVAWSLYDYLVSKKPGDFAYHAGSNAFADGHYEQALDYYRDALEIAPGHTAAQRGLAETLIMLEREREAIALYDELLAGDPGNAGYHANRGIARDRLGEHELALVDYERALRLDASISDGPGWLTRFLRNQPESPPGIAERAEYLRAQLALPEDQRRLQLPGQDAAQRPYKL